MNRISSLAMLFIVTACGGGGGGGGGEAPTPPPTPAPGISFSATPTSVLLNNTSTFSWSTTNATSCTASGSTQWSGSKATSGTEDVPITISGNTTFTLSCSGSGGTRNASVTVEGYRQTDGVVVDGYISGADVFIDENENFIADGTENSTTSDNDGKFTIKYANGSLVSIGGTDLDSQTLLDNLLITHKLTGHSDFKAITPVTSVDAFLESVDVNAALGIDSSINIAVDDPVALKGDGGIYDYLYEKGNQLTVLAYALQNITNDLNTTTETTQDFFKSIAEEVEAEYTETQAKVDIETEAFIAKALDNVINIKSLNIEETAKQNTLKALSGVLPIIEVKSSDDLTTSVIRFGVATLQEDIKAIANGTADEGKVESYTTDVIKYIAEDQGISSDEITPDITAIDDNSSIDEDTSIIINVLANDSFITTSPISIDASNGDNGTVGVTKSSPPQITYSPNSDYFGNDLFSYTITQGDKTSSAEVEVDINPINDVPSIDIASTLSIPENQTAITTVSVSDPDEDDLTLTLSGEDANSLNLTSENVLSFNEEPDFETKAAYSINLSLTDGEETVDKDISIVITNVNDIAPEFTSEATFSVAENQTAIGTVTAKDAEGDDVTFTVSGDELAMTSAGVLTFVNEPDFETKASYTATVTATDGTNPTTQDVTVNITNVNDIAPEFTSEATFSVAENQTAIGTVTAKDAEGDDVTFTVSGDELAMTSAGVLTFVNEPDFETKASYTATVTATDGTNPTTQDVTVSVLDVDEIAPVLTVTGDNPATVELGASYTDAGATSDDGSTVKTTGTVDTNTVGSYTVTYSATDASGNTGTATRTVNVVDTTAPVITVTGDNPVTLILGATYADAGATADDGSTVKTTGAVDTNTVGSYTVTYSATDASGNTGTATRTVTVQSPPPEFGLDGRAVKGVIGGGTITVVDSAGADVAIASGGTTGADGSYTIIFDQAEVSAPIVVTVAGGDGATMVCDIDLAGTDDDCAVGDGTSVAFGESYPLPATFTLRGLVAEVPTEDGASATVNITPASDLATNLALDSADTSSLTAAVVEDASSQVLGLIQTITGIDLSGLDINDIAIPDVADSADAAAASESSLALAAFSAAIIANQGEGETVGDVIARVNASLSANAEGNLVGSGTELSSLVNSVVTALTTVSAQVTAGGGDSSAVDASIDTAEAIEETYESIGDEDVAVDTTAPIITITGANPITLERGTSYIEVGASADGGETVTTTGTVDTSTVGTYKITYSAYDGFNTGTATRTVNVVDTTDPVISVTGDNPATVELGATYTDAGAVAVDFGQSIDVSSSSTLDTSSVGSYKVTYSATDASGNTGTATRTVNVVDTTKPLVIVNGANPTIVELGDVYTDAGATTSDFGAVTLSEDSDVNSSVIGTYSVVYTATDASGNSAFATRTVNVVDTTAPVITVTGDNPATAELAATYTDAGATADGDETVTTSGTVDTNTVGTYTLTYSATDTSGNTGTATRTVNVVDTTAPVITVTGDNPATAELAATYTDAGATADGDETVTTSGTVDTNTVGTYTLTYSATDTSGNTGTATRTVNVVDTTAPVITVTGDNPATAELAATYTDAGATADGDETVTTSGTVDTNTVGTYTLTYSATDTSGNTGTATRTVNVVDTTAPVFTSNSSFTAAENQTAIDTVTANDLAGEVTFTVSGSELAITSAGVLTFKTAPDYETKSTYTETVTASDGTNTSTQDITVNVTNVNEEPVITNLTSTIGSEENQLNVFQVNAVDYEGDKIYYSLSGIDREFFNIDSSGLITFTEAPDYEAPLDNGADNLYSINIIVSDTEPSSINNLNIQPSYSTSRSIQASNNSTEVSIINVDEDLIDLEFNTTDGTLSKAPSLSINLVIDELTKASEVQVLTWLIGNNQTWYTASKVDSLNWSINESLNSTAASGTYEIRRVLIKRDALDDLTIVDMALKEKGFDIDSIIYNAGADSTDPILTSIDSISVSGNDDDLNTNIIVTIVASVTDGEGEIDKVFSYIKGPGGEIAGSWGTLNSDKTKVTFTFTLDPRAATGTYTINDIRLFDVAGNQKFYSNSELVAEGFTNSWEISNTLSDNTAPNIVALSLTPSINTSDLNRKQITIDLTTDEQVTDINDIYIRLISPDNASIDQYIVDTGRLFTTTKNGNSYSHTISLPLEYPDGIYNISYIFLNDKALNNKRYEVSELNLLGFNTNVVFGSGNAHAPDITSSSTFSVNENQTAIGTVTATDADGDTITYSISGSDITINSSTGAIVFASAPNYETKSSYSATVTVSDGTNSTTQDITVNVTDVTEAVAVEDSSSGIEDDNIRVDVLINDTFISSDVTLTATDGTNMTVEVQNDATSVAEYGHPTIIYSPDANWFGTDTFTYTVSSGGESDQGTVSVTVTSVNDAPTITSVTTFSAAENQTDIGTVTATDIEDDTLAYSISGSDISIDSSTGVMTFNSAPDYETTTSYSATVKVSDGTDSDTQDITVNITNVVENSSPVFTSSPSFTVAENQTSAATIVVTDADNDSISFSLSGADAGSFTIASSGALTFNNAPDYETKESYSLIVSASDGTSSVSQTISINISNVNEVPQISALSSTHSPNENQTSIVTVSASDPDANTSLTYSVSGTDSSLFSISSSGVLTFKTAPDYETPSDADADNSYQINIIVSDGSLSVTQAITIQVQNVADLISGVAVDGYVAGATVFQDLNNDGDLDSGEPSAATNSLGSFSLNLSSVNINAPVRIYNGFDLASNEIHPSVMDISVSETGSYIVTPISTLVGRLKIEDTSLSAMVPQSMIAGALGISLADSPNDSILGFDPIAYFNGSDATLASEARPVFAASQLLMTMGGGNYSVHKYITDQVLSSLSSTLTTAAGSSITLSSANDILGLKQDAYDAIFNGYVDTTLANNPPINSIQFRNNKAVMTDYLNGSSSSAVNYSLYGVHDSSTTLVADLVGAKLDYDNLKQILDNDSTGTPMDLNFELANIPAAGSGSTGVTLKLFYGDDVTQGSDEDYLQIALTANWESDGTNFEIKLPASSSIKASFYDRGGTVLSITPTNQVEDIFTVTKDGPNRPATLSLRLSKLFNAFPTEVTGLSSFLDGAAEFTYLVEFDNFTIYDHLDNTFTKIQGTFGVNANPGITVFADDIYVHENATSKDISFYLSQAASSDVTLDYTIADASTASSSDYSLSSGTITIPAGSMSATLTIPVTNDITVEAQEEIRLTLSNVQNAVLGRNSVSAFITDGEEILANTNQKAILADNIFKDSKASINAYIKNKLDTSTVTISGTSYTYSQVLINNSVTTDVYAYLDSIIDDYEVLSETLIGTIMTKADAYIDAQLSSFADYTAFATALTQLNSGIKGLNMSQIVGTNINSNGTFPSGQNATTLQTALDGKVDTLVTLAADTVADILGTDTNTNFPNANVIMGTDGDDTITGTSGSDLIATFGGTDTVNALAGNDKILGGSGVDTLNGGDDNDHLYGYAGADTLNGNAGDDLIYGGKDDDTIDGDAGDDSLYGEAGDDTITSGSGNDTLDGGLGDDTFIIDSGSGTKTVSGSAGTDTLNINFGTGLETFTSLSYDNDSTYSFTDSNSDIVNFTNIESFSVNSVAWTNLVGNGSSRSDTSNMCAGYSRNQGVFSHPASNKVILFDWNSTSSSNITNLCMDTSTLGSSFSKSGGHYSTTLYGSAINDIVMVDNGWVATITAGDGDDVVHAKDADAPDDIDMGAGDDFLIINSDANDTSLDGGAGSDWIAFRTVNWGASSAKNYTINSGNAANFENLLGTDNDDTLSGDANANIIVGSAGADTINGNDGNDTLWGDCKTSACTNLISQNQSAYSIGSGGDDILNGGDGDDTLYGEDGDDTLNGGAGNDTIVSGSGNDVIVITSSSDSDTLTDFTNGTDAIGFDSSITSSNLVIEASGSDTVIKNGSDLLLTLSGISSSNVTAEDLQSTSTDAQTLNGTSGDDTLIGGAGDDTFNGKAGSDTLIGWGGDDTFNITNKSGSWTDTINGGSGTDVLDINYSINLEAFASISYDNSAIYSFVDSAGGTMNFQSIETLNINSVAWTNLVGNGSSRSDTSNMCAGYSRNQGVFSAPAANKVILFDWDSTSSSNITNLCMDTSTLGSSFSQSGGHYSTTLYGSSINDIVMVDNGWVATITAGDGDDVIHAKDDDAPDDIDMGAGDDFLIINSDANDTSLDGGTGSDWIAFRTVNWGSSAKNYTINSGNAANFENLLGTDNDDTLNGDANANIIVGSAGADTINGNNGNDTLWGDCKTSACTSLISQNQSAYSIGSGGNDTLNGGAGDDTLYGEDGDDTLNGGAGNDTIVSGSGNDVIVITSSSDSDTLTDFTDGTDAIGFDSSITSSNLVIEPSGSDTVVKNGSDVLLTLSGISSSNVTAADLQSTSTDAQTLNGTSGNDMLIGGAGDDTFNGGAGSDILIGWGGDDTFNITSKSGSWTDTINGGSGTDILNISYSINLEAFNSLSYDNSSIYSFVDSAGGTMNFQSIETLNVNSVAWTNLVGNGNTRSDTSNMCAGYSRNDGVFSAPAANKIILFDWDSTSSSNITNLCMDTSTLGSSFSQSGGHYSTTLYGSAINDIVMVDNGWVSTITMGEGDDIVHARDADAPDDIDMGAGNDFLIINSDTNDTSLDGGLGSDWIAFRTVNWGASSAKNYTINSGVAANFENLLGTDNDDTLNGDANANIIVGSAGADTINGNDGNDTLWGDCKTSACRNLISQNQSAYSIGSGGNDTLNGGAGDDTLYGEDGDDTLDGGAGADTYTGGAGIDVFTIKANNGGASISGADVVTDFDDGTDLIGMSGLEYTQLTREQGTGDYANHVIVKKTDTGEFLLIIQNTSLSSISNADFSAI